MNHQYMAGIDIELNINRAASGTTAALSVELPDRRADLTPDIPITLDEVALRSASLNPEEYSSRLTAMLFLPMLREAWQRALGFAEGRNGLLRVRLHLRADDTLHAIRWELLRDPITNAPLAYSERIIFSRFLSSEHLGEVQSATKSRIRALLAVSTASGPNTAQVDVVGEIERATAGLGTIPTMVLDGREGRSAATLSALAGALRAEPNILYLVCHGSLVDGKPYLWLERQPGEQLLPIPGDQLVQAIANLSRRPQLVVMAACRSAGDDYTVLSAVGPALARIGVSAVLAMQGDIPQVLLSRLMPQLFLELQRDGQIDRALAAARAALPADMSWWRPVLWMATKDGALWRVPQTSVPGSFGAFQVPYPPNPLFVGRNAEMNHLAQSLLDFEVGNAARVLSISGVGGIGKTQLASEFAHRYRDAFPGGVFWLNMEQPETIASQIAATGGPGGLDLPGWNGLELSDKIAAVRRAWAEPVRRLLVFDNLEEPKLLQEWRPSGGGVRILVTTRRGVWSKASGVVLVSLSAPARSEGIRLLLSPRYGERLEFALADPAVATEASTICELVGDLPLAIALAGIYLEAAPSVTLKGYRARLQENLLTHPSLEAELEEGLPTRHAESVLATIALSYQRLNLATHVDALACTILQRVAVLSPVPIPQHLIMQLTAHTAPDEEYAAELDQALRRLASIGLLELLPESQVSLHRLIAAFVRTQDLDITATFKTSTKALIDEIHAIDVQGRFLKARQYLPHFEAIACQLHMLEVLQGVIFLNNFGYLLKEMGDLGEALKHYNRAFELSERTFGAEHIQTAVVMNNMSLLHRDRGDYDAALLYCQQALTIRRNLLGFEHIDTARSLNNLGLIYVDRGDYQVARELHEQALTTFQRNLGFEHTETATLLNNLALVLDRLGEISDARRLYEKALEVRRYALGDKHPDTALSLNNLGSFLLQQAEYTTSRPLLEQAIEIWEQTLGLDHPFIAMCYSNLGCLLKDIGDLSTSRRYTEQALDIRERVLGPDHPDTANSLINLGGILHQQGFISEAQALYERALKIWEQKYGPTHPHCAVALASLGHAFKAQGEYNQAKICYERALTINEQSLGLRHIATARSYSNLGFLSNLLGDYPSTRSYFERTFAIYEQGAITNNVNYAEILNNFGLICKDQGDYALARSCFDRALDMFEQLFGQEHASTATVLNNLGTLFEAENDYTNARSLYERALTLKEQVLDRNHSSTIQTFNNLSLLLEAQGDAHAARALSTSQLDFFEQELGAEHLDTLQSLKRLAYICKIQGDDATAYKLYMRLTVSQVTTLGASHPDTLKSLTELQELSRSQNDEPLDILELENKLVATENTFGYEDRQLISILFDLGWAYREKKDLAAAAHCYERILTIIEHLFDPTSIILRLPLRYLGYIYQDMDDFARAREAFERSLAIHEQAPDLTLEVAEDLTNLARVLKKQGALAEARRAFERAADIRQQVLGAEPETAQSLTDLAYVLQDQGASSDALLYFERALAIWEQVDKPPYTKITSNLEAQIIIFFSEQDFFATQKCLERIASIQEKEHSADYVLRATTLSYLASIHHLQGDAASARAYLEQALSLREQAFGLIHTEVATTLTSIGTLLYHLEDYAAARHCFERALKINEEILGPEEPNIVLSMINLGYTLCAQSELTLAQSYLERAERILIAQTEDSDASYPRIEHVIVALASIQERNGNYMAAQACYERALATCEQNFGPDHINTATILNSLGSLLDTLGSYALAGSYHERALRIREQALGPAHTDTIASRHNLGYLQLLVNDYLAHLTFEQQLFFDADNSQAHYWLAIAYLNTDQYKRALEQLARQRVLDTSTETHAFEHLWHSLVVFGQGDETQATELLAKAQETVNAITDDSERTHLSLLLELASKDASSIKLADFVSNLAERSIYSLRNLLICTRLFVRFVNQPHVHAAYEAVEKELDRRYKALYTQI